MAETRDDDQTATQDTGSRYTVVGLAIAAVIVLAIFAAAIWMNTHKDAPGRTATPVVTSTTAPMATQASTSATPTKTPTAPEQQATASAEAAYRQFISTIDQVGHTGGSQAGLTSVAIGEELVVQRNAALSYSSHGWHTVGSLQIVRMAPQHVSLRTDPKTRTVPEVVLSTCLDATNAYAVDRSGKSVRPATAPTHYRWTVWVRYYPQYGGVGGWFVAKTKGQGVPTC